MPGTCSRLSVALLYDHHQLRNVQQLLELLPALVEGLLLEELQQLLEEPLHRLLANGIALVGQQPPMPTSQLQDGLTDNYFCPTDVSPRELPPFRPLGAVGFMPLFVNLTPLPSAHMFHCTWPTLFPGSCHVT